MTEVILPAAAPLHRLLQAALRDWCAHQGRFWSLTAPAIAVLTAAPYAIPERWWAQTSPWVWWGAGDLIGMLVLYQWFKHALYGDWHRRRALLLQKDSFPWGAFLGARFATFWALHFVLSYAFLHAAGWLVMKRLLGDDTLWPDIPVFWSVQRALSPLNEFVLASLFGSFLLLLPASAAGLRWTTREAFRRAAGLRSRLIFVMVAWAILLVALPRAIDTLVDHGRGALDGLHAGDRILIAVGIAGDLLASATIHALNYILAFMVSGLFIVRAGWMPEPAPDAAP